MSLTDQTASELLALQASGQASAIEIVDSCLAAIRDRDPSLKALLAHNRDEEKEHACMGLEWLRRRDPTLDRMMRTYLFTTEPVTEVEAEAEHSGGPGGGAGGGSLGIGSLKVVPS